MEKARPREHGILLKRTASWGQSGRRTWPQAPPSTLPHLSSTRQLVLPVWAPRVAPSQHCHLPSPRSASSSWFFLLSAFPPLRLCTSSLGSGLTALHEQATWNSLCGWGLPAAGGRGHVLEVNVGCDPSNSQQPLWASASHLQWEPQHPLDRDVTCRGVDRAAGSSHAPFHKPSHLPQTHTLNPPYG